MTIGSEGSGLDALEDARRRFVRWRGRRERGARIPEGLWAAATAAARTVGVSKVSTTLGVDYYGLKERLEAGLPDEPGAPRFGRSKGGNGRGGVRAGGRGRGWTSAAH
jgi:hypothetical protein